MTTPKKARQLKNKLILTGASSLTIAIIVFVLNLSFSLSGENSNENSASGEQVVLAFVTYNDFGNNLYIDNLTAGRRVQNDVAVTSINNIKPGETYLPDNSPDTIAPKINITNLGLAATTADTSVNALTVFLRVFNFDYWDSVRITTSIAAGATYEVTFNNLVIFPGTNFLVHAYTRYTSDTTRNNDTLYQFSNYLAGVKRKVLFQEFTSATSPSAASNNIFLNAFLGANSDNVTSIKYHRGVPPPGTDSMYLANAAQSDSMRLYYNTFQVPSTIVDGRHLVQIPYSLDSNLLKPYNARINEGSPVFVEVSDSLISADTILSTVTVDNLYNLSSEGSYTLKLNVIERYKMFSPMPSSWYDSTFIDIFRSAVPGISGIVLPLPQGKYVYQFKFYVQPGWNTSKIYTVAFVQNEYNREILNSARSKNIPIPLIAKPITYKPLNPRYVDFEAPLSFKNIFNPENSSDTIYLYPTPFIAQTFESYFTPPGWRIKNPDALVTFDKYTGVNGPQLAGNNTVRMPFYFYSYEGQRDTLISAKMYGLKDTDTIKFDYAYAQYSSASVDSLKVLISNDGGKTYFPEPVFNRGGLGLATAPSTTIAFAPINSNQWRTFSIGLAGVVNIRQISSNIPDKFTLHQNYPNPFNPTTKIKFDINKTGFVKLKIYDITGREIASLVNMQLNAGQYEYKWNAVNYASGVYFYTINFNDVSLTKRMVLVK